MIYTLPLPLDPTRAPKDQSFTLSACFEVQLASVAILVERWFGDTCTAELLYSA